MWKIVNPKPGASPLPALEPFDASARADLAWAQPKRWNAEWWLVSGAQPVAVMRRTSLLGMRMELDFKDRKLEMRWRWRGELTVGEPNQAPIATIKPGWFGSGRMFFPDAPMLKLKRIGLLRPSWELRTDDDLVLIRMQPHFRLLTHETLVQFEDAGRTLKRLPECLALMWFAVLYESRQHNH